MLTVVQKLANEIECPKCQSKQNWDVRLFCLSGVEQCYPQCTCNACGTPFFVRTVGGIGNALESKNLNLVCDPVSQVCEVQKTKKSR